MGNCTATAEGEGLCTKSAVAQTNVHERVYKRSGTVKCPICSQKESVKHAMVECSMFKAAAAVVQHYCGPVDTGDGKSPVRDMMEST